MGDHTLLHMGAIRRNDETRASARATHPVSSKVNGKSTLFECQCFYK